MTKGRCERAWEASAIEDGRLDARGKASFERHVESCAVCAAEHAALRSLRDLARLIEPDPVSSLEHRRLRQRLLRAANARALRSPARSRRVWARIAIAACALAVLALFVGTRRARRDGTNEPTATLAPVFDARPVGVATWHGETTGSVARVFLSDGTLSVHVQHLRVGQRFLLELPDGELEVRGTRFIAEVARGRTERVLVTEGAVAVRIGRQPERLVLVGESWMRPPDEENGVSAPLTPPPNGTAIRDESRGIGARKVIRAEVSVANRSSDSSGAGKEPSGDGAAATRASREFLLGMAAFSSGQYLDADEHFAELAAHFHDDSHCEDAVYLRTVIALRRGDRTAALARARDYLHRFPDGLRRAEMQQLVDGS